MDRGRPLPLNGALVVPKQRRFERIALTERGLQLETSAIQSVFRGLRTNQLVLRGCKVRRHVRRLVANIMLGRLDPSPSLAPYRDSNVGIVSFFHPVF